MISSDVIRRPCAEVVRFSGCGVSQLMSDGVSTTNISGT